MNVELYGAKRCHKTQHYISLLKSQRLPFAFYDVEQDEKAAEKLRSLYVNKRLNFPTITLDDKTLRNPSDEKLIHWIEKLKK